MTKPGLWRWLMAGVLLLAVFPVFAQVKIQGKITDPNGEGLTGVSVLVKDTRFGTFTELDGTYALDADLAPGSYTLIVSYVGFKTGNIAFTVDGKTVQLNYQMAEDILSLDEEW